jgi:DNA-binding SARP family transcriptional activator
LRYELLGPLRVVTEDGEIASIGAQKIETLLAALLIRSDQVVATEQLMTEIWGAGRRAAPPRASMCTSPSFASS